MSFIEQKCQIIIINVKLSQKMLPWYLFKLCKLSKYEYVLHVTGIGITNNSIEFFET